MYNLLIGLDGQTSVLAERLFEYTMPSIKAWIQTEPGYRRMLSLPALVMPEVQRNDEPKYAQVGEIRSFVEGTREHHFQFVPNSSVPAVPLSRIVGLAGELGVEVDQWEFQRTHWAVKDVDLYRVIFDAVSQVRLEPKVFSFPENESQERDLLAVMMPFSKEFSPVYDAIKGAAEDAGLRAQRADDIWINTHIMEDIISLLWRSEIVVSDLTGKNPNVFYETGIAHSIGRRCVQITQAMNDVPFDLRSIRTLSYLPNTEGLQQLRCELATRLLDLREEQHP